MLLAEGFSEPQRIQADVSADDMPARDSKEVGELTGAAADFQHRGVIADALIESSRIRAATGLIDQRANRIMIVVVREGRFFIERLDDIRHVAGVGNLLVRPKKLRDVVDDWKRMAAVAAD